jgi:hypothetical protein
MIKELVGIENFQKHLQAKGNAIIKPTLPEIVEKVILTSINIRYRDERLIQIKDGNLMALPGDTMHSTSMGSGVINRLQVTKESIKWIKGENSKL